MSNREERRRHPRLPLRMLVQFRLRDMDEFYRDHAVNISAGGMFVRTRQPQPLGSMVYLQFRLRDGLKIIEGLGKVVHVNGPDEPVPGMGIEFENLDAESRAVIDEIIRERLAELE